MVKTVILERKAEQEVEVARVVGKEEGESNVRRRTRCMLGPVRVCT